MNIHGIDIHEFDEVTLSGVASSPVGQRLENAKATVATVSDGNEAAIKVWPHDERIGKGKVWIWLKDITAISLDVAFDAMDEDGE